MYGAFYILLQFTFIADCTVLSYFFSINPLFSSRNALDSSFLVSFNIMFCSLLFLTFYSINLGFSPIEKKRFKKAVGVLSHTAELLNSQTHFNMLSV